MNTRSPHPPSARGRVADLWRRARLTLKYHGPRELALRLVAFPLRGTPLGRRLGHGRRYGPETARARHWYAEQGRPVTVLVHGSAGRVPRSVRRTTSRRRTRVVAVEGGFADAVRHAAGLVGDVALLRGDADVERGWLERLQYGAYQSDDIGITGPKLLDAEGRILSAGVQFEAAASGELGHRCASRDAALPEANIITPVIGLDAGCLYVKRAALAQGAETPVDLSLRGWERCRRSYYIPSATVRTTRAEPARSAAARSFFGGRDVRTTDDRLRVVYVTEDTGVGGGHRDVFEHLNRLAERGHEVELFSLGEHPSWFELEVPTRTFKDYGGLLDALEGRDAIKIATWWNTAAPVWLASVRRGIPVFFVQDIETSYYPDSADMRSHVLASYRPEFHYMTISGWNRDRLREVGLDATLVPPGLDVETFRPLTGVVRREDMLLALGRSNPLKNLPLTLDAWSALGAAGARPELCLFGIEPELGPRHGARYVERPSDAGVNRLLNEATVFVQTSTHEGFCLPPLEAMATGGAVVCTDAHGNRDFCVDGVNCLMPDPTVESVAGAVRRLLDDSALRARLGRAGLETAADYAWERRIDQLEGFLEGVAERRSAALRGAESY
jgi:glycosyltransferase involved in cell wall biosynthesis